MKSIIQGIRLSQNDSDRLRLLKKLSKTLQKRRYNADIKKQLYEALGDEFFTRLLEMDSIDDLHKKVAISILCAIGYHPDLLKSRALLDNVAYFRQLLVTTDSGLQDDVFDLLEMLLETNEGMDALIKARIMSVLCRIVATGKPGVERALPITTYLILMKSKTVWDGCENDFHTLISHLVEEYEIIDEDTVDELQDDTVNNMCIALTYLLQSAPESCKQRADHPWLMKLVEGLGEIFNLKLSPEEREPALVLVSTVVDTCGIYSMLPPYTPDSRLYVVTVNLCCAELRMLLQDTDIDMILERGILLDSCSSYLGRVIMHMKEGLRCVPPKHQEQIRSALAATFTTVINFLNSVSNNTDMQYTSSVLRVVRTFTAFLVDETSALRQDVYQLIPFVLKLCKQRLPPSSEGNDKNGMAATDKGKDLQDDRPQAVINGEMSDSFINRMASHSQSRSQAHCQGTADSQWKSQANDHVISSSQSENQFRGHMLPDNQLGREQMMSMYRKFVSSHGVFPLASLINMERTITKIMAKEENIVCLLLPGFSHWAGASQPRRIMLECGVVGVLEKYLQHLWDMYHRHNDVNVKIGVEFLCNIFYKLNKAWPNIMATEREAAQPRIMATEKEAFGSAMSLVTKILKTESKIISK